MAVDNVKNSPKIPQTNAEANAKIESGKTHSKEGGKELKKAGRSIWQGSKDAFLGTATYAKNTGKSVAHATVEGAKRSRVQSPHAFITPWKGIGIAAVLAGAGWAAPKFTTASYALTLTVPGVAFTIAGLAAAAAVYSFFANVFTKPKAVDVETAGNAPSGLTSKAEMVKHHESEIERLKKEIDKDAEDAKAAKQKIIEEKKEEIDATATVQTQAA